MGTMILVEKLREQGFEGSELAHELVDEIILLRTSLKAAAQRCQLFLNTFGEVSNCVTQADINDWQDLGNRE